MKKGWHCWVKKENISIYFLNLKTKMYQNLRQRWISISHLNLGIKNIFNLNILNGVIYRLFVLNTKWDSSQSKHIYYFEFVCVVDI